MKACAGRLGAAVALALGVAACGSQSAPVAQCAPPIVIGYPPPPAQVEFPGVSPEPGCQWVDGSWEWVGRRWQWQPGAWVRARKDCVRAAPIMIWLQSEQAGVLYYRPASFCPRSSVRGAARRAARARCAEVELCGKPPAQPKPAP